MCVRQLLVRLLYILYYIIFLVSTNRWQILLSKLQPNSTVVKSLSQKRWSARADTCRSLCCSRNEMLAALQIITNDASEKPATCSEASDLLNSLESMETCFLALFWNDIQERFNTVNKKLQSVHIELGTVPCGSLHVPGNHGNVPRRHGKKLLIMSQKLLKKLVKIAMHTILKEKVSKRKRNQLDENKENEAKLSGRDRLRVTVLTL